MAIAPHVQVLIYEGSGAAELAPGRRFAVMAALLDRGYAVRVEGGLVAGPRLFGLLFNSACPSPSSFHPLRTHPSMPL